MSPGSSASNSCAVSGPINPLLSHKTFLTPFEGRRLDRGHDILERCGPRKLEPLALFFVFAFVPCARVVEGQDSKHKPVTDVTHNLGSEGVE